MLCSLLLVALFASVQGRAVNISNTWVLPEEGFPVFYRYFRDRISWYEADAVCQFHHANLVTVDTTAQYDAVRAYLKELDISSAVWVGLIRSNPDGDFTWTDYRGLSGEGYWSSAPDARSAPLCAAADPAADYRWEARACGGPTVASFICELPVPQWALGNEGCMVRALPALTVLYLPESAAVQLTADCGMAGVKRVQCTGNVKHEELLRDLSCSEEDDSSQLTNITSTVTTWVTTDSDQEMSEAATEDIFTTEHDDNPLNSIASTPDLFKHISVTENKLFTERKLPQNQNGKMLSPKRVNLDVSHHNNLQSNDIPKLVIHDSFYSDGQQEKQEDEKHMQHKLLHDELARLGNFENIFSQPTDHFIPPLVMAKAKVNDDMTAVSFEEKLAQQNTEYLLTKHLNDTRNIELNNELKSNTVSTTILSTTEMPLSSTINILKDKKELNKHALPKKYDQKSNEGKIVNKSIDNKKSQPLKISKNNKSTTISSQSETVSTEKETTTQKNIVYFDPTNEDSLLDLTVIIKEPELSNKSTTNYNINITDMSHEMYTTTKNSNLLKTSEKPYELSTESSENHTVVLNDEIIKITFIHDDNLSLLNSTEFEITTKMPIFKDITESPLTKTYLHANTSAESNDGTIIPNNISNILENKNQLLTTSFVEMSKTPNITSIEKIYESSTADTYLATTADITSSRILNNEITTEQIITKDFYNIETNATTSTAIIPNLTEKELINDITISENLDDFERNITDPSQYIDDFQSPLLSGANEPLHKPNRSRRPQQPANRIKKFNPFRILG